MKLQQLTKNKFGEGKLWNIDEVETPIYIECAACLSVYADILSWANYDDNHKKIVERPHYAKSIIILGCQVTDLSVLHDINTICGYHGMWLNKPIYLGGCVAKRFDIQLPHFARRLNDVRRDGTLIKNFGLVTLQRPYWVSKSDFQKPGYGPGKLFRDTYPLRIGVGCKKNCTYCTIKTTRGGAYEVEQEAVIQEWEGALEHHGELFGYTLIADSPTAQQLKFYCEQAMRLRCPINLRNVEPDVAAACWPTLIKLAKEYLLESFHCPIQSMSKEMLEDMGRDWVSTNFVFGGIHSLQQHQVRCATNIIIDYKDFPNNWVDKVYRNYDYVSWNPYWDGNWDVERAERKWRRYFGS